MSGGMIGTLVCVALIYYLSPKFRTLIFGAITTSGPFCGPRALTRVMHLGSTQVAEDVLCAVRGTGPQRIRDVNEDELLAAVTRLGGRVTPYAVPAGTRVRAFLAHAPPGEFLVMVPRHVIGVCARGEIPVDDERYRGVRIDRIYRVWR